MPDSEDTDWRDIPALARRPVAPPPMPGWRQAARPLVAVPATVLAWLLHGLLFGWQGAFGELASPVLNLGWVAAVAVALTVFVGLAAGLSAAMLGFALEMWLFLKPAGVARLERLEELALGLGCLALVLLVWRLKEAWQRADDPDV